MGTFKVAWRLNTQRMFSKNFDNAGQAWKLYNKLRDAKNCIYIYLERHDHDGPWEGRSETCFK